MELEQIWEEALKMIEEETSPSASQPGFSRLSPVALSEIKLFCR